MARRRKSERVHEVRATLQVPQLTKAGSSLNLKIFAGGEKVGEITLGRGSVTWFGRRRKTPKRLSWSRFAEMMDRVAYGD